ncbi:MAG TPA: DUF58 domain-containing protein [Actinobacteria bacterium]|nr:DUF58 domain-containing protein [Actinomycetota bacterium]
MLLDAETRQRLARLTLRARHRVRAARKGRHRSYHLGEGLDFADYREYAFGDDYRRIDHHLRARLGVTLVRLYETEEELPVRLVIDRSASMGFYGKLTTARLAAAVVAYLGLAGGDRVLTYAVPGLRGAYDVGPTGRHVSAWPQIEDWLEDLDAAGSGSLDAALPSIVGHRAGAGIVVLVGDLLEERWPQTISGAGIAGGGLVLHVLAPEELDPPLVGDVRLVDVETGRSVEAAATPTELAAYRDRVEAFVEEVAAHARRAGLVHRLVTSPDGVVDDVVRSLVERGAAR